jgi:hypothetical protein
MKPEDEEPSQEPSEEELREAAALAHALEPDAGDREAPADALEAAALLRHARAPIAVPPAHEPLATAQAAQALDARRTRTRRRAARWIATSLVVPGLAAAWLMVSTTARRSAPPAATALPAPSPALLAAQAEAARGGGAALARLDLEMRAYRRAYHDGLRRRGGGAP